MKNLLRSGMICENPYIKVDRVLPMGEVYNNKLIRDANTPFPCGRCLACRINRARMWQNRILLEASCHSENVFVTLTYNDEHLPDDGCVSKRELQLYIKRLRRNVYPKRIRYYGVGEYGEYQMRPHYHLCIFGIGPCEDIGKSWMDKDGEEIGFTSCSGVGLESARYVSNYVTKFKNFEESDKLKGLEPEFSLMSRKPGLGVGAVSRMALKFHKYTIGGNNYLKGVTPKEVKQGSIGKLPLGRYLTSKLQKYANLDPEDYDKEAFVKVVGLLDQVDCESVSNYLFKKNEGRRVRMHHNQKMFGRKRRF